MLTLACITNTGLESLSKIIAFENGLDVIIRLYNRVSVSNVVLMCISGMRVLVLPKLRSDIHCQSEMKVQ